MGHPSLTNTFSSPEATPLRLTYSGNATLFHGVPDWVYEEEVLASASALWWSPTSSHIAYLSLDETNVLEYVVPVYNPTPDAASVVPYGGDSIKIKYPKPGYGNPLVQVVVCDLAAIPTNATAGEASKTVKELVQNATTVLTWDKQLKPEDQIVSEVAWVGNETLVVREVGREAREGHVVLFDVSKTGKISKGKIVRVQGEKGEEGDKGWIESVSMNYTQKTSCIISKHYLSRNKTLSPSRTRLAILTSYPLLKGFATLPCSALPTPQRRFGSPLANGKSLTASLRLMKLAALCKLLSSLPSIHSPDCLISYFQAAKRSSISRGIYSVALPSAQSLARRAPVPKPSEPIALTDDSVLSWYSASFSPKGGYYVLSYGGPGVPWQRVVGVETKGHGACPL